VRHIVVYIVSLQDVTHLKDMDNKSITPNDIEALLINTWDCPVEELHMI
jgi:hypothetical protein